MAYQLPSYLQNSTYGYKPPAPVKYTAPKTPNPVNNFFGNLWSRISGSGSGAAQGTITAEQAMAQALNRPSTPLPTINPGYTSGGGGGGGLTSADNDVIALQRRAIADARARLKGRAGRYLDYFKAQSGELDRQLGSEKTAIAEARAKAGKEATKTRGTLGTQNEQSQADVNKRAQASGIFDSSARHSAIGVQQKAFEEAIGTLNDNEKEYYTKLDRELGDLKARYSLAKQNIEISEADTEDDIAEKMLAFEQAERDIDARIAQIRASAVSAASRRTSATGDFFSDLSRVTSDLYNMPTQFQTAAIQGLSQQYNLPQDQVEQYYDVSRAIRDLQSSQDPNVRKRAQAILRQNDIDPSQYGA